MLQIKEVLLDEEQQILISFLSQHNLEYEYDIDYSILVYDEELLVAMGAAIHAMESLQGTYLNPNSCKQQTPMISSGKAVRIGVEIIDVFLVYRCHRQNH